MRKGRFIEFEKSSMEMGSENSCVTDSVNELCRLFIRKTCYNSVFFVKSFRNRFLRHILKIHFNLKKLTQIFYFIRNWKIRNHPQNH